MQRGGLQGKEFDALIRALAASSPRRPMMNVIVRDARVNLIREEEKPGGNLVESFARSLSVSLPREQFRIDLPPMLLLVSAWRPSFGQFVCLSRMIENKIKTVHLRPQLGRDNLKTKFSRGGARAASAR